MPQLKTAWFLTFLNMLCLFTPQEAADNEEHAPPLERGARKGRTKDVSFYLEGGCNHEWDDGREPRFRSGRAAGMKVRGLVVTSFVLKGSNLQHL